MEKLLRLLDTNARLTDAQLAAMLDCTEEEIKKKLTALEREGIVRGYKAVIDWEKTGEEHLTALIELRVTPQPDRGFEEIAEQVSLFDEVESVYLMSGTCDIALTVTGKTFKDVAMFVAHRLAPLDSVQSTSTSFVLRTYKELGVFVSLDEMDEREVATL